MRSWFGGRRGVSRRPRARLLAGVVAEPEARRRCAAAALALRGRVASARCRCHRLRQQRAAQHSSATRVARCADAISRMLRAGVARCQAVARVGAARVAARPANAARDRLGGAAAAAAGTPRANFYSVAAARVARVVLEKARPLLSGSNATASAPLRTSAGGGNVFDRAASRSNATTSASSSGASEPGATEGACVRASERACVRACVRVARAAATAGRGRCGRDCLAYAGAQMTTDPS